MKINKALKVLFSLSFIGLVFASYLWIYPNDFFLSDKPFQRAPNYQVEKTFFSYKVFFLPEKTPDLEDLINHLDEALKDESGWFKNNSKRTVSIIQKNNSSFFVKRYNSKNFLDYCSKCPFRSSKAFRSFFYAYYFKQQGLPTPEPIALVEKRVGFFWTKCYLISKKIEGQSLDELLEKPSLPFDPSLIQAQLTRHLTKLYENQWIHRDLTLRNIFFYQGKLYFLDLDDIHSYAFKNYFFKKKFFEKHQKRLNETFNNFKTQKETLFLSQKS